MPLRTIISRLPKTQHGFVNITIQITEQPDE